MLSSRIALAIAVFAIACGSSDEEGSGSGGAGGTITGVSSSEASSDTSTAESSTAVSSSHSSSHSSTKASSSTGPPPCMNTDPGEPNDTEAAAYALAVTGCSDSDPGTIYGVIDGPDDVDWFFYVGQDELTCVVNPTQGLTIAGFEDLRLCAYYECLSGPNDLKLTCPAGTNPDTSPGGRPGCCGQSDFSPDVSCGVLADDSAYVFFKVYDPPKDAVCAEYTITFHF